MAAIVGAASAILVVGLVRASSLLQQLLFGVDVREVSAASTIAAIRGCGVPVLGGMLVALIGSMTCLCKRRLVDPIEANALYGGRVPAIGSVVIVVQTLVSSAFGASVGMEAAYTQGAAAIASALGAICKMRRSDLRTLVGCGAASAIAAAFNAPLAGAFYAFELVIANYTLSILAPIVVSALTATWIVRLLGQPDALPIGLADALGTSEFLAVLVIGVGAACLAIVTMRGVGLVEKAFRNFRVPVGLRPSIGGLTVGALSLETPAVLSSGHGALHNIFSMGHSASFLAGLLVLKVLASTISIGAGFRGGLFFASLLLGAILGQLVGLAMETLFQFQVSTSLMAIVGMGAMSAAVLGCTLSMVFLALETTGNLSVTVAVLAASTLASLIVRRLFGYSFATWRFHLRGEAIRSAADIGWLRDLTVGDMMKRDVRTVSIDLSLSAFRDRFALGSVQRVVAIEGNGRYAGLLFVADAYAGALLSDPTASVRRLTHCRNDVLLPEMRIDECAQAFVHADSEELVVVDDLASMNVAGVVTEQHVLRRYTTELDQRSREWVGG